MTPEAATIYYVVDEDFNFYFLSESNSRKVENFRKNPHVALVVGTEDAPVTAQIEGDVSQLENGEEFMEKFEELEKVSHQGEYKPVLESLKDRPGGVIYKIKPTWLRWTDFRESSGEMRSQIILIP